MEREWTKRRNWYFLGHDEDSPVVWHCDGGHAVLYAKGTSDFGNPFHGPTALADAKRAAEQSLKAADPLDVEAAAIGCSWHFNYTLLRDASGATVADIRPNGGLGDEWRLAVVQPLRNRQLATRAAIAVATLLGKAQPAEDAKPTPPESPDNSPFHLGGDPALLVTPAPSPAPEQDEAERFADLALVPCGGHTVAIYPDGAQSPLASLGLTGKRMWLAAVLKAFATERDAERDARIAREAVEACKAKLLDRYHNDPWFCQIIRAIAFDAESK